MKLNHLGVPVYINGRNYYIPSLSFSDFRVNAEFLGSIPETTPAGLVEYFDKLIPIIGLAIRRNYPEMSDVELSGLLDLTTLGLATKAVQNASGMTAVAEGE